MAILDRLCAASSEIFAGRDGGMFRSNKGIECEYVPFNIYIISYMKRKDRNPMLNSQLFGTRANAFHPFLFESGKIGPRVAPAGRTGALHELRSLVRPGARP